VHADETSVHRNRSSLFSPPAAPPRPRPQRHPVLLMARQLDLGGSERQLCEMARSLDRDRFEVHVGCFRHGGIRAREIDAHAIPLVEFPVRSFRSLPNLWTSITSLCEYARRHKIRLVHAFDPPSSVFVGISAAFLGRVVVLTSQRSFRQTLTPGFRACLRLSDRLSDGVIVNCKAIRDHLTSDEWVSFPHIHLCHNGVDGSRFRRSATPRNDIAPARALVIGTVCGLRPEKDLPTLLRAFAACHASDPNVFLVLVGDGPQRVELQRQARDLGIASHCLFQPTTHDVVPWLSVIDIFVLPSTFEALSNALMEAMACACACVASRVGGNPELVQHNDTGLLFEKGHVQDLVKHLQALIGDANLRQRLGRRAAVFIGENFSLSAAAERLGAIYDKAMAARKPVR
jgi:L-malate glycosyltransferase